MWCTFSAVHHQFVISTARRVPAGNDHLQSSHCIAYLCWYDFCKMMGRFLELRISVCQSYFHFFMWMIECLHQRNCQIVQHLTFATVTYKFQWCFFIRNLVPRKTEKVVKHFSQHLRTCIHSCRSAIKKRSFIQLCAPSTSSLNFGLSRIRGKSGRFLGFFLPIRPAA